MIDSIYEALGRFREDDTSGHLHDFIEALGTDLDQIDSIVGEGENDEPTWTATFDLDRAPTSVLPWLAQFVGVQVTPSMSDTDVRAAIRLPAGYSVGTHPAILTGIQRMLTGTKRVVIRTRTPDAGTLYIRTLSSETPDPAAVQREIRNNLMPWHLTLDYQAVSGISYIDLAAMFTDYDDLAAADLTYDEVSELEP